MLFDKLNEFSDSQVLTVNAISTNVIDTNPSTSTKSLTQNLGGIGGHYLCFQVDVALLAAGAATLTISLESDSTADLATSPTVHWTSAAIGKAALIAGYQFYVPMPIAEVERYLGVRYAVGTGPFTAGSVSAFITREVQNWRPYDTASASN